MNAAKDVAQRSVKQQSVRPQNASFGLWVQPASWTTVSKQSISVLGHADACSNAGIIHALSFVTRVPAAHVEKPSLKTLDAIVGRLSFNLHYHVAPLRRRVDLIANGQPAAAILEFPTTAIKRLKNQPCWLADVRCGEVCGKKLKCGSHFCRKPCHRLGECEDASKPCQQSCGKAKKACGHPCEERCHAPSTCREDKPCQNKMLITCDCQHLKQEIKCNASKTSEGNSKKTLTCDDECARLARNQRLALALNIDPEAHKDDHIPYSSDTLKMFRESIKWAQTQEREFRVFAADESEKRLRFKPMPAHQRAFLHSLSEDFGLDSESMDPEPHRHVAVFKTPRFVMAPMKTLSECVRIRATADAAAASTASTLDTQRKLLSNNAPLNAFLLTRPRFGLTVEELRSDLSATLDTASALAFDISFLPSEEIKTDEGPDSGGWSQVAAKAAAPRSAPRQVAVGEKSVFTVLGSKLRDAKRRREEEEARVAVVEDWEEEAGREEEGRVGGGGKTPGELAEGDLQKLGPNDASVQGGAIESALVHGREEGSRTMNTALGEDTTEMEAAHGALE
ncbi:AP-3 complex subunit delta [Physcia stellaris]|nr:AP-3 complex subunit delta [Physcia stellaris]